MLKRDLRPDGVCRAGGRPIAGAEGFSCEGCGSPSVLLPRDLASQSLVLCDRCRRPLATLAEFRSLVEDLIRATSRHQSMS